MLVTLYHDRQLYHLEGIDEGEYRKYTKHSKEHLHITKVDVPRVYKVGRKPYDWSA